MKQERVYVQDKNGRPLMPTVRFGHVRKLMKSGRAKPVCNNPFIIRLKYDTLGIVQELYMSIDPGSENIGIGISDSNGNCIHMEEIHTCNKSIRRKMDERRIHRHGSTIIASLLHSYEALAQSGKSPAATFTFETKMIKPSIDPAGTEKFRNVASVLARTADGTGRPVAGIETGPINPLDPEGWKNQFLTSNLEEYQKYYGGAGTYHIRETRAPQGYDLSGTMTVPKGGDDQYVTTNLQKGIVIALAYTWNGNDYDAKYMLNGHPIASDTEVRWR